MGNLDTLTYPNGVTSAHTYDDRNRLTVLDIFAVATEAPNPTCYWLHRNGTGLHPFFSELHPTNIRRITTNHFIFFASIGNEWTAPVNGTIDDCQSLRVAGEIISIAPNGRWLAFHLEERPEQVHFQHIDIHAIHSIVLDDPMNDHYAEAASLQWAPDSHRIAYVANYTELWTYIIATGERYYIENLTYFWCYFLWSPNSQHIAYIKPLGEDGPGLSQGTIYTVDLTTHIHSHVVDIFDTSWGWSADSHHIIYTTHINEAVCVYEINIVNKHQRLMLHSQSLFDDILSSFVVG